MSLAEVAASPAAKEMGAFEEAGDAGPARIAARNAAPGEVVGFDLKIRV